MDSIAPIKIPQDSSLDRLYEYKLTIMTRDGSQETYGIAAPYENDLNTLYVKEIGTDKEAALAMVATLNRCGVSYVHFLDVICDLMNEQS